MTKRATPRTRTPVRARPSAAVRQAIQRRNKVIFGLPLGGSVDSEVVVMLLVFLNNQPFLSRIGQQLASAHNDMVREALAIPRTTLAWDYLWWLEHDHTFNWQPVYEYVQHLDPKRTPIVNFLYVERKMPCLPVVYDKVGDLFIQWGTTPESVERMREADTKPGLYRVTGGFGMGCTVIHRSVFERLADDPRPWYHWAAEKTGEVTDDLWFCQRAIEAGFPLYVETRFDIGHWGKARYDKRHFWAGLAMQMPKVPAILEEVAGPQAAPREAEPIQIDIESVEQHPEIGGGRVMPELEPIVDAPAFTFRDKRAVGA